MTRINGVELSGHPFLILQFMNELRKIKAASVSVNDLLSVLHVAFDFQSEAAREFERQLHETRIDETSGMNRTVTRTMNSLAELESKGLITLSHEKPRMTSQPAGENVVSLRSAGVQKFYSVTESGWKWLENFYAHRRALQTPQVPENNPQP